MAKKPKKGDTDYLYYGKPKKDSWVRDTAGTTKSLDKELKAGCASESYIAGFKRYMNYKTARQEQENRGAARAVSSFEKSHAASLKRVQEERDNKLKRQKDFTDGRVESTPSESELAKAKRLSSYHALVQDSKTPKANNNK